MDISPSTSEELLERKKLQRTDSCTSTGSSNRMDISISPATLALLEQPLEQQLFDEPEQEANKTLIVLSDTSEPEKPMPVLKKQHPVKPVALRARQTTPPSAGINTIPETPIMQSRKREATGDLTGWETDDEEVAASQTPAGRGAEFELPDLNNDQLNQLISEEMLLPLDLPEVENAKTTGAHRKILPNGEFEGATPGQLQSINFVTNASQATVDAMRQRYANPSSSKQEDARRLVDEIRLSVAADPQPRPTTFEDLVQKDTRCGKYGQSTRGESRSSYY